MWDKYWVSLYSELVFVQTRVKKVSEDLATDAVRGGWGDFPVLPCSTSSLCKETTGWLKMSQKQGSSQDEHSGCVRGQWSDSSQFTRSHFTFHNSMFKDHGSWWTFPSVISWGRWSLLDSWNRYGGKLTGFLPLSQSLLPPCQLDVRHLSGDVDRNATNQYPVCSSIERHCLKNRAIEGFCLLMFTPHWGIGVDKLLRHLVWLWYFSLRAVVWAVSSRGRLLKVGALLLKPVCWAANSKTCCRGGMRWTWWSYKGL